jgi:hypothetical protein
MRTRMELALKVAILKGPEAIAPDLGLDGFADGAGVFAAFGDFVWDFIFEGIKNSLVLRI